MSTFLIFFVMIAIIILFYILFLKWIVNGGSVNDATFHQVVVAAIAAASIPNVIITVISFTLKVILLLVV